MARSIFCYRLWSLYLWVQNQETVQTCVKGKYMYFLTHIYWGKIRNVLVTSAVPCCVSQFCFREIAHNQPLNNQWKGRDPHLRYPLNFSVTLVIFPLYVENEAIITFTTDPFAPSLSCDVMSYHFSSTLSMVITRGNYHAIVINNCLVLPKCANTGILLDILQLQ